MIEVNDNPSIESVVEDKYLGDKLYDKVMREFLRRLEGRSQGKAAATRRVIRQALISGYANILASFTSHANL